jgi:hypothetical protein
MEASPRLILAAQFSDFLRNQISPFSEKIAQPGAQQKR